MEDTIFTRVSIREFTDEPVSDEQIERLMKAAMAAPSAGNQQPWEFVLTRDPQVKEELAACSPYAHPAGKCDLVIVPCISGGEKRFEGCVPLDMSACTENILLESQTLGLGAVWAGHLSRARPHRGCRQGYRGRRRLHPLRAHRRGTPQGDARAAQLQAFRHVTCSLDIAKLMG